MAEELGGGDLTSYAAARLAYAVADMPSQLLESITARSPLDPNALWDLGFFVDLRSQRYSEAEVSLKRALDINPHFGSGHFMLGVALLMQGKLDEALADSAGAQCGPSRMRASGTTSATHVLRLPTE